MKNLKSVVKNLVKEAITNKIGEGQPVGGIKDDHEFDAGRHNVMKAVNIGEKVGFDGKYVNDMESGVAVKKLHGLDENTNQQGIAVLRDFTRFLLQQLGIKDQSYAVAAEKIIPTFMPKFEKYFPHGTNESVIKENEDVSPMAYKMALSIFGKNNVESVKPTPQVSPEISTFLIMMKPKREGFPGAKTYIRYLSDTKKWEKWDGKNYSPILKESVLGFAAGAAVGATATIAYKFVKDLIKHLLTNKTLDINSPLTAQKIDMFMKLAKKQNPNLKDEDIELVRNAFNTALKNGSIKTVGDMMTFGKDVFSEETGTGAVAGYATPYAFSKKKEGSSRAIASAKKYGTVVKSISEKK